MYVSATRDGKELTGFNRNFDWVHYPRLSVYLTPNNSIGIIGPYDSAGQIFDSLQWNFEVRFIKKPTGGSI
jgi:hypothetical protein